MSHRAEHPARRRHTGTVHRMCRGTEGRVATDRAHLVARHGSHARTLLAPGRARAASSCGAAQARMSRRTSRAVDRPVSMAPSTTTPRQPRAQSAPAKRSRESVERKWCQPLVNCPERSVAHA